MVSLRPRPLRVPVSAAALAGMALALLLPLAARARVDLRLEPVDLPDDDARVEFVPPGTGIVVEPGSDLARPMAELFCTTTTHFRVCADLARIGPAKFTGFEYPFYVVDHTGDSSRVTRFLFLEFPRGRFFDRQKPVQFVVQDVDEPPGSDGESAAGQAETGTITLPLHAVRSAQYLDVHTDKPIQKVSLGGGESIWLSVESHLEDLPLVLDSVEATPTEETLWRSVEVSWDGEEGKPGARSLPLRIDAGQGPARLVKIVVSPSPLNALWHSLDPFPSAPGGDASAANGNGEALHGIHDRILVTLAYHSTGGNVRYLHYEIPVRFVPSVPGLILAVALGALVGCAIPPLLGKRRWKHWWRAAIAALLIAFCVELLAMVLWNFNSRVKVLGFDVDPYQLVQVVLLGVFVGFGGYRGAALLPGFPGPDENGDGKGAKPEEGEADDDGNGEEAPDPVPGAAPDPEGGDPR